MSKVMIKSTVARGREDVVGKWLRIKLKMELLMSWMAPMVAPAIPAFF